MATALPYELLADAVLVLHFAIVLFVIGGLLAIVAGNRWGWPWVNRGWFRALHAASIATVVAESWWGLECPLTTLEAWLRTQAGGPAYATSFIQHWVHRMLFYEAPAWVFALAYTTFGVLVAWAWWRYPPGRRPRGAAQRPRG